MKSNNTLLGLKSMFYIFIAIIVSLGLTFLGWTTNPFGEHLPWYFIPLRLFLIMVFFIAHIISWILGTIVYGLFMGTSVSWMAEKSVRFVSYLMGTFLTLWIIDSILSAIISTVFDSDSKKTKKSDFDLV